MNYEFPKLRTLNDVLPAIRGADEFIVADRGEIQIVNYMVNKPDTFFTGDEEVDAIRRECRGLVFDSSGILISRPYHKFFNVGENEKVSIDALRRMIDRPHWFMEKLDGSMVRPIQTSNGLKLGTKMGFSETALRAQAWMETATLSSQYAAFMQTCVESGLTPIFEWVSPEDRIVIDYGESCLYLTALRDNLTGLYMDYIPMKNWATEANIPVVWADIVSGPLEDSLKKIRAEEGSEGYVIRFEQSGHMTKVKNEWYVTIHRSKDIVSNERLVVKAILEDVVDDLKPLLLDTDLARVNEIENAVNEALLQHVRAYEYLVSEIGDMDRKTYALGQKDWLAPFVFRHHFGGQKGVLDSIRQHFRNHTSTNKKFDEVRHLLLEG